MKRAEELAIAGVVLVLTACVWPLVVVGRVSEWLACDDERT